MVRGGAVGGSGVTVGAMNPWEPAWEKIAPLDAGGQATTHEVRRRGAGTRGVLKLLNRQKDPERRARFHREAAALETLQLEGVPRVLDHNADKWREEDKLFIVMEYIEGPTLAKAVSERVFAIDAALETTISLLTTVRACHEANIVHRDIKPDNIILRGGRVAAAVLVDFGLSFNLETGEATTKSGENLGNRFLELPELHARNGNKRDPRSDVTSVVGVLFYLLTGSAPHVLVDEKGALPHQRAPIRDQLAQIDTAEAVVRFFDQGFQVRIDERFQSDEAAMGAVEAIQAYRRGDRTKANADLDAALAAFDQSSALARLRADRQAVASVIDVVRSVHTKLCVELLQHRGFVRSDQGGLNSHDGGLTGTLELGYWAKVPTGVGVLVTFQVRRGWRGDPRGRIVQTARRASAMAGFTPRAGS